MVRRRSSVAEDSQKYMTVSLPRGIAAEIDHLIEELGYWPSRGAFVRDLPRQDKAGKA